MQKRKFLTAHEVESLLDAALQGPYPERNHCLILMAFIHGLRVTELLRLRLSDIDIKGRQLNVVRIKNSFSTVHPLLMGEKKALKAWFAVRNTWPHVDADNDWLFVSRKGTPLSRQQFYYILTDTSRKAELSICAHPHMLRHACGYALANNGIDTRLIQDYLGHKNIRHTVRYTASNAGRFEGIWRGRMRQAKQHFDPKCKPMIKTAFIV